MSRYDWVHQYFLVIHKNENFTKQINTGSYYVINKRILKTHMVHFVYLFCDLPVWGAVETSAAQHWDNDKNKNSKAIKLVL